MVISDLQSEFLSANYSLRYGDFILIVLDGMSQKFVIQNLKNNRRRNFNPGVKNNKNPIRNLRAARAENERARRPVKSTGRTN